MSEAAWLAKDRAFGLNLRDAPRHNNHKERFVPKRSEGKRKRRAVAIQYRDWARAAADVYDRAKCVRKAENAGGIVKKKRTNKRQQFEFLAKRENSECAASSWRIGLLNHITARMWTTVFIGDPCNL
jgi:hypothetical protein